MRRAAVGLDLQHRRAATDELTLDLGAATTVSAIVLITEQTPDGETTQMVEASDDGSTASASSVVVTSRSLVA